MDIELLDPIWCAEFRGFFWGEGYLGITSWGVNPNKGSIRLMARIQISIRDDDADVLIDIHRKLGGVLTYQDNNRLHAKANPICIWRVTRKAEILRVLDVLENGALPSKKRLQIAILREFMDTVPAPGKKPTQAEYLKREHLHRQIKQFHSYQIV